MKKLTKNLDTKIQLRIDRTFKAQLKQLAEKKDKPFSEVIRNLVTDEYQKEFKF